VRACVCQQGISETSSDIRDLLKSEKEGDERAREAVDAFCYQAKKYIGAFAAVLSGVETLVFAGGIGENSSAIRARICDGLEFLGIEIDEHLNEKGEGTISTKRGKVRVMVIPTDEETMLARELLRLKDSDKQSNDKDGDDK
jgi:acetate kinase